MKLPSLAEITESGANGHAGAGRRLRVLVLSRNYPNSALPFLGLWVERPTQYIAGFCDTKVISPVPYCPPLPGIPEYYLRYRRIERSQLKGNVEVIHPRFFIPPGFWSHGIESLTYYLGVSRLVDRLRRRFPFDLIHAHFVFPDGWVAAKLGERYGVPVVVTDHASWRPWMDRYPRVRRQALWAIRRCAFHIVPSNALRESVAHFTGESEKLRIIPNSVDASAFTLPEDGRRAANNQILFVGVLRPVKGLDILLRAVRLLADRGREVKLVVVGASFYKDYAREGERMRQLVGELGLNHCIDFLPGKPASELSRMMQESTMLVLPSRRESMGMVLVEALACGTPVVATRCGGPEDTVTDEVGVLVKPEDPQALALGIESVLLNRSRYEAPKLRAYALDNFGPEVVSRRILELYDEALRRHSAAGRQEVSRSQIESGLN